jgi:hypothetical protein
MRTKAVVDKFPKSCTVTKLGDLKAKLEKQRVYSNVTGKRILHEETNRNSDMFCEFVFANNKINMTTQFQYKQIHKITCKYPNKTVINRSDHV